MSVFPGAEHHLIMSITKEHGTFLRQYFLPSPSSAREPADDVDEDVSASLLLGGVDGSESKVPSRARHKRGVSMDGSGGVARPDVTTTADHSAAFPDGRASRGGRDAVDSVVAGSVTTSDGDLLRYDRYRCPAPPHAPHSCSPACSLATLVTGSPWCAHVECVVVCMAVQCSRYVPARVRAARPQVVPLDDVRCMPPTHWWYAGQGHEVQAL